MANDSNGLPGGVDVRNGVVWLALFFLTSLIAWNIFKVESQQAQKRQDLAALQHVKLGLFNVDSWKEIVAEVVTDKVESFDLNANSRYELDQKIQSLLRTIISDLERNYHAEKSSTLFGLVRNIGSDILGVFQQMRRDVPEFSRRVVEFLDDPSNREALRNYIVDSIARYADSTFGQTNYAEVDQILEKYSVFSGNRISRMEECVDFLDKELERVEDARGLFNWTALMVFIFTLVAMYQFLAPGLEIKLATATILLWLLVGINAPMLLLEARISSLEFFFAGTPVSFSDQVLFFQSKSIWEVVWLLLFSGNGMGPFLAGFGVLLFSVVIPLLKLGASFFWNPSVPWGQSAVGRLLLFDSSKWAMADVMVVAIFLSNLGFDGLLKDQVGSLGKSSTQLEVLTTAHSTLLPGFFAFFAFALCSILLSHRLKNISSGA